MAKRQIRQVQFTEPEKLITDMDTFKQFSLLKKIAKKLDIQKPAKYLSSPPASPSKNECYQYGRLAILPTNVQKGPEAQVLEAELVITVANADILRKAV